MKLYSAEDMKSLDSRVFSERLEDRDIFGMLKIVKYKFMEKVTPEMQLDYREPIPRYANCVDEVNRHFSSSLLAQKHKVKVSGRQESVTELFELDLRSLLLLREKGLADKIASFFRLGFLMDEHLQRKFLELRNGKYSHIFENLDSRSWQGMPYSHWKPSARLPGHGEEPGEPFPALCSFFAATLPETVTAKARKIVCKKGRLSYYQDFR